MGIFNQKDGRYMTVARKDDFQWDALATHQTGEIILSGSTVSPFFRYWKDVTSGASVNLRI